MSVFIDTSALYAVLDRDDANHKSAGGIWLRLLDEEEIMVTHNYVVLESTAIIQNRLGMEAARTFISDVFPLLTTTWVDSEIHFRAQSAFLMNDRRQLSLTDCFSFEVMRGAGIRSAFAFDRHFAEQGFTLVLS